MLRGALLVVAVVVSFAACSDDEPTSPPTPLPTTGVGGSGATTSTGGTTSIGGATSAGGTSSVGGAGGDGGNAVGGSGGTGGAGDLIYQFDFEQGDGTSWPSPWTVSGGVDVADIQSGQARLIPTTGVSPYPLARMALPGAETDVEILFTLTFTSATEQGFGFYARSNGGHLQTTNPAGEGYAVFINNALQASMSGIGLWVEENGSETQLVASPYTLTNGTPYRVRFRVEQTDAATTTLQARIWEASATEPGAWTVETTATDAHLQNTAQGFAVDHYWQPGPPVADLFLDDVEIRRLP